MSRAFLLSVIVAVLAASTALGSVQPDEYRLVWYLGNVDPNAWNAAGPGLRFQELYSNLGTVVYDDGASDKLAWRIANSGSAGDWWVCEVPEVDHILGATVVARVKTVSDIHGAGGERCRNLGILDPSDAYNSCVAHWGGATGDVAETLRAMAVSPGGDDGWHIIRMTMKDRDYWADETWSDGFESYHAGFPLVGQGDWEIYMHDAISVEDEVGIPGGSSGHGRVVRETYPGDGEPPQAAIQPVHVGPDGTGKMELRFDIHAGTGGGNSWKVRVNDIDGNNIAYWYGGPTTATGRVLGSVTPSHTLGADWESLKMVIDTNAKLAYFYYYDTGVVDWVEIGHKDYTAQTPVPTGVIGSVDIETYSGAGDQTIYFDNFDVAGAHYDNPADPRTIKIYLDEAATPALTISPASARAGYGEGEGFAFGVDDPFGLGNMDILYDWVTATNRGAFAPGQEVAVVGKSLVPTPSIVTTIEGAKQAQDYQAVQIQHAIVNTAFTDDELNPIGFGIEDTDRSAGIRVLSGALVMPGWDVTVTGTAETEGGERVIDAVDVTFNTDGNDIPEPLAMNNKATGGGNLGQQFGLADLGFAYKEEFNYPDGALLGWGGWRGDATMASQIGVEGGELKVTGGAADVSAIKAISWGADTAAIVSFKAVPGVGSNNIWYLHIVNTQGNPKVMAEWYGSGTAAQPRIGGNVLSRFTLDAGGEVLVVKLDFVNHTAAFYRHNGAEFLGTLTMQGETVFNIGKIILQHYDTAGLESNYIHLDDLKVNSDPSVASVGLSDVGLLVTISGKVTGVNNTSEYADGYFYVDDGTGISDGSGTIGIKCRPPTGGLVPDPTNLPAQDRIVQVTGLLGLVDGQRFLWTWEWNYEDL